MASQCKRQQCTIDRRGFRQELDSWRHKLIHCVGFESILDGLFGPELVEDLKFFKDFEPTAVSDWSFDENCLFCCLRRDKVKEHLIGLSNEDLEDTHKPLLVKDRTAISRLEKQAEEFLNAVLSRKDVPNFSDPHIPVVAREILQRMIRQFAAEYTSKTSSPQDGCSDSQPRSDQSLPTPPLLSGAPPPTSPAATLAGPAHNQNPVLSKLLMADQDAPLDLTIKKPLAVPSDQDGVLDLSIKKNRYSSSSSLSVRSPCLSPATSTLKGRSLRADGQVGLFMRSLQDGRRRENIGHSTRYKPSSSLAYSLHIKEEADLESDPESPLSHNHSSRPTDLFRNGSASWNSKTHFGALLKLRTNSGSSEHLKDIPRLLEAAGLLTKSLAYEKGNLQEACRDHSLSLSQSSSFDLKIPQVRVLATGTDPSWDSLSTDYSGSLCENGLGKTLRSILPRQVQKKSSGGFSSSGSEKDKDYWPYDTDRQALSGNYLLDTESDLANKQPRKKRGRYRQYNTELLEEAIVVVMGGKMSVSKAQSIYGIPHSTLEYKVKERLGTLKHPPKKKPKLISQVEEQDVTLSPERNELQTSQHIDSEKKESAFEENGNDDGSLSSNDEFPDLGVTKARDLQSTSTLEEFMAKLCPHHQRQIVDAIGFLQTEVKAVTSSNTQQDSHSTSGIQGTACTTAKSSTVTPEKSSPELRLPSESTLKSEVQDMLHSISNSCAMKNVSENMESIKTSVGPALDLRSPGSGSNQALVNPTTHPMDAENNRHGEHAPLKMKIMTSNVAAGKKLSCVLNTSLSSHSDNLEDREGDSNSFNRTETPSARLSSSVKRQNQPSHTHQGRQRETVGHAKDAPAKLFSVHMTIPSDSPRTARKTIRASSDHRIRDSACRGITDPDLGHCDIVFIDKPITESFKEQQRSMVPRRNARKSTRGHMYSDEIWELKTVRTLAGRGNCLNPMSELITLVTPKQMLSKPEGVPPVDMPFVGTCRETMNQQMSTEDSDESVIPGTGDMVEVAATEVDVIVETSQTDQCQSKGQSVPPSPIRPSTENKGTDVEQDIVADSGMTMGSEESVNQPPFEAEKDNEPEPEEDIRESTAQIVSETVVEPLENVTAEEAESQLSPDKLLNSEPILQQNNSPLPMKHVEDEKNKRDEIKDAQPNELQPETQLHHDNFEVTEMSNTTGSTEELILKEQEIRKSEAVDSVMPLETEDANDNDYDVTSKTLDALLKELPPWRRKKGTVISLPKRLKQTKTVVVGYVNGRPISASDRSLRRRSSNSITSLTKTPVKSSQNVPNKTCVDSTVDNQHLERPLAETNISVKSVETTLGIQQVKEPSSATPSSPTSKFPSRTKQIQKQKRVQRDQDDLSVLSDQAVDSKSPESKRQLRSAAHRPAETPVSPPTSNAVTSISSPNPNSTNALLSTEDLPSLALSSPPSVTSPLIRSSTPASPEQSQQNPVPETTVELNIQKTQPVGTTSEEIEKYEVENRLHALQKLSSTQAVDDDSQNEEQQTSGEVSSPFESQSPVKTEMQTQILPIRSKRVILKESEANDVCLLQKPDVASFKDKSASGDESTSSILDKPTRMPLRSESSKAEMSHQSVTRSPPVDNKKLPLRSQRLAAASTSAGRQIDVASPIRIMPERITKTQVKPYPVSVSSELPHSSAIPVITPRPEPPKQTPNKFFQTLTGEENQHLITNLNIKYDRMQKGWVQMDKEGQPATRYKNKADRQAAIWKSKRRARKTKSLEQQKYSPVQMLFMKGFNLTSICRWFLESTETKSLVIVKKVNTRLPSETQLCFHSSSSASGTSQGVFPSLQAERLKKHLKKFAIASPVKCNPKSQKLIAKALEQEANAVKGKERRELPSTTQTLIKSHSSSEARLQISESQKTSGRSKNPASARILRKYSNIREKIQQTNVRLNKASKALKTNSMTRLAKSSAKSNLKPSLKTQKSALPVRKRLKESAAKMARRKTLAGKKTTKHPVQRRAVKAQSSSRASRDTTRKEKMPKRCSQRLGSPRISEHNLVDTSKSKVDNKKQTDAEKVEVEKPTVNKMNATKIQTKESSQSTLAEIKATENAVDTPHQSIDVKVPISPDQVLTRSQRKIDAAVPLSRSSGHASKTATKAMTTQYAAPKSARKAEELKLTRSGALKSPAKRSRVALMPRSVTKLATKRARGLLETPAKRTRTSFSK